MITIGMSGLHVLFLPFVQIEPEILLNYVIVFDPSHITLIMDGLGFYLVKKHED